jgi:hypothetical protein
VNCGMLAGLRRSFSRRTGLRRLLQELHAQPCENLLQKCDSMTHKNPRSTNCLTDGGDDDSGGLDAMILLECVS